MPDNHEKDDSRKKRGWVALTVVVLAILGVILLYTIGVISPSVSVTPLANDATFGDIGRNADKALPKQSESDDRAKTRIPSAPSGSDVADGRAEVKPKPETQLPPERTIRLRFIDAATSHAIPGFSLAYGRVRGADMPRVARGEDPVRKQSGTADDRGEFILERLGLFVIKSANEDWVMIQDGDDPFSGPHGVRVLNTGSPPRGAVVKVHCVKPTPLTLIASYSDGTPFEDTARYAVYADESMEAMFSSGRVPFNADGQAEVLSGVGCGFVVVHLESSRFGWPSRSVFRRKLGGERTIYLTVEPEVRAQYGLELVFPEVEGAYPLDVVVRDGYGVNLFQFSQPGPGTWRSPATYNPLKLEVHARGDFFDRKSVQLEADRWISVTLAPKRSCSVTFKVLDEQGAPVFPAVAVHDEATSINWSRPKKYEKEISSHDVTTANKEGLIKIERAPSGAGTLVIESLGFEAQTLTYSAEPGEQVQLPDVVMRRYSRTEGTVTVRISNTTDASKYRCGVSTYDGRGGVDEKPPEEDGLFRFEGLPFKRYVVYVVRKGGGSVWQEHIHLTAGRPSSDITIDVSQPDTGGNPGD